MGKKKSFIDKNASSTYHVVRRSMRDVTHIGPDGEAAEVPSDFVLMPSPSNRAETDSRVLGRGAGSSVLAAVDSTQAPASQPSSVMSKLQRKIASAGLLEDTYDYDRHLLPITGTGVFFSGESGHIADAARDSRSRDVKLEEEVMEVDRQLDSIAMTPDCMDDDIAKALFGDFEEGAFEELLDDFCITAAQEPDPELRGGGGEGDTSGSFDYDAHIRSLIEKAERQARGEGNVPDAAALKRHPAWSGDGEFFNQATPLHLRNTDEDDEEDASSLDREFGGEFGEGGDYATAAPGVVSCLPPDEERALCEKFEQTLLEYDSDDVGDLDEECEVIRGEIDVENNKVLEAVFDDFLEEKKDEIFIEGTRHLPEYKREGGSGYSALVGGKMVDAKHLARKIEEDEEKNKGEDGAPFEDVLAQADKTLANPEMEPAPFEDVLIDGKSYFSERNQNPFDCESILTTYSNLDNNPAVVGRSGRRRGKAKERMEYVPEDEPAQIFLSNKTGLPLGVLPTKTSEEDRWDGDDTFVSINKGEARLKSESKAEKKARKAAVKEERRVARMQKKMMKEAFAEEFERRAGDGGDNDLAGKSVFRIA